MNARSNWWNSCTTSSRSRSFRGPTFPHKVGLHNGCATLRALREAERRRSSSRFSPSRSTCLPTVKGIEFVTPERPDECCGFGGTFSVFEEPVSAKMGQDKVNDHSSAGAEYIVSADMSCLMHQKGCAERLGLPVKFIHIAQILNGLGNEAHRPRGRRRRTSSGPRTIIEFHDRRLWDLRKKRDRESEAMPEWEELRSLASAIKEHTLTHLADYLEEFERNATKNGVTGALGAGRRRAQRDRATASWLEQGARRWSRSKSMLTDECDMRPFLEKRGIKVIETDLGERIQQLDDEPPSHIVVPAVHKLRADVAASLREPSAPSQEQRRALPGGEPAPGPRARISSRPTPA